MGILDLVFPKTCLECKKEGKYICEDCLKKVPPGGWVTKHTFSLFRYKGVIRKAIIALKYKYSIEIAKELAKICIGRLYANRFLLKATLVPIPLHWYHQNFRGFNQSAEIGKIIAGKMGWKFIPDLLVKRKPTTSQVELKGPAYIPNTTPNILVFDDVLTTGSTLKEATDVLYAAGAKKVLGLTIVR